MTDKRDQRGRFVTGNNGGPGRRPGSRNRLAEDFIGDVHTAWAEHGPAVLAEVRKSHPLAFARLVSSLVPTRLDVGKPTEDRYSHLSSEEMAEEVLRSAAGLMDHFGIKDAAAAVRRHLKGGAADRKLRKPGNDAAKEAPTC